MAWLSYYINCDKIYGTDESGQDVCIMYNLDIPPHGGIRREWTTHALKHGEAKVLFVEYQMEDDDPDGVWEAYGMKAESEYTFTVNAEKADPEKLFVYTLYSDGTLGCGFDIDTEKAEAIIALPEARTIDAEAYAQTAQKVKAVPRDSDKVEGLVRDGVLGGSRNLLCLAFFKL